MCDERRKESREMGRDERGDGMRGEQRGQRGARKKKGCVSEM